MGYRKHPRTDCCSPVHFISAHIPYRGCILDAAQDGIRILPDAHLEPGTEVKICYSKNSKVSINKGIVAWSSDEKLGIKF